MACIALNTFDDGSACVICSVMVEWNAETGYRAISIESQEGYRMENKKAQALDDDLLENIIGGISLRGVFRHTCRDCQNVWYNEQGTSACPRCGSSKTNSWPS